MDFMQSLSWVRKVNYSSYCCKVIINSEIMHVINSKIKCLCHKHLMYEVQIALGVYLKNICHNQKVLHVGCIKYINKVHKTHCGLIWSCMYLLLLVVSVLNES